MEGLAPQHRRFTAALCAFYLRRQRFDAACILLEALHLLYPQHAPFRLALAYSCLRLGANKKALHLITPLAQEGQGMTPARRIYCRALWACGRLPEARNFLRTHVQRPMEAS